MQNAKIAEIETEQLRTGIPDFRVGDTVRVHYKIVEGDKDRIQVFQGVVLKRHRAGARSTFTVRKVSFNVGGACGATASSPARPIVDGGADANGSSTATCDGDAGVCEESPSCCIITADSVNLADNCAGPKPMVLNCQPTKCGAVNLATGCYQRSSGDGGIETYSTSTLWSPTVLGPGFVTCPASVQSQVEQINKTCP
jgi:hypothetical protein